MHSQDLTPFEIEQRLTIIKTKLRGHMEEAVEAIEELGLPKRELVDELLRQSLLLMGEKEEEL